ncbi:nuclease, putative [Ricinus communis]|uniref:Nuclease, putative n=1 Tax=Ricinus communis TaxID=3988 RepID=B9SWE6_RICCO|nr:nuclease, putative [Ricinus communis]
MTSFPIVPFPVSVYHPLFLPPFYVYGHPQPYVFKNDSGKVLKMVGWIPPPQGWFKINTDGTWKKSSGIATAAGLFRNCNGQWCGGFAIKLRDCYSAFVAELFGILNGLNIAWNAGFRNIILETDNKTSVDKIYGDSDTKRMGDLEDLLITSIKEMLTKEWNIKLQHQYREGNRVADALANFAVDFSPGQIVALHYPPESTISLLMEDIWGMKFPRICAA